MLTFLEFAENKWYHGSPEQFESFKLGKYRKDQQLGFGIHFARERKFAELYGPYIYTCQLSPSRVLDETKIHTTDSEEYGFAKELYKRTRFRLMVSNNMFAFSLDVVQPKRAFELLTKYGYDAVLYEAKYGTLGMRSMSVSNKSVAMTMLNPSKIKIEQVERA